MALSDMVILPSYREGLPRVLVEAAAMGKPVVASRIPPITEIVVNGETGLLVEPDNPEAFAQAIVWLLKHPAEARKMGEQGTKRVHNVFSVNRMAQETLRLYKQLLNKEHGI